MQTPNIMCLVYTCITPWYVAIGVFAVIGQPSKQVTLVTHKSEAVSNPRAGRQAGPGCSGFKLLPQPASSLSDTAPKSNLENLLHDRVRITT